MAAVAGAADGSAAGPQQAAAAAPPLPARQPRAESPWRCPACNNPCPTPERLLAHLSGKCCADLLAAAPCPPGLLSSQQQQPQPTPEAAAWLEALAAGELALRRRVLRLMHVADAEPGLPPLPPLPAQQQPQLGPADAAPAADSDDGSEPGSDGGGSSEQQAGVPAQPGRKRRRGRAAPAPLRSPQQIAAIAALPLPRVLRLIERAPRSIQLVADTEPVQVVYEDAHFLAICKPHGLRSAPVHRFRGGSALSRMIGHLGYEPHLLHRLDMHTSGVLVAAKDKATAAAAHAQFRAKAVRKAYLALCLGTPAAAVFAAAGSIGQHPGLQVARRVVAQGGQEALTGVQVVAASSSCGQLVPPGAPRANGGAQPAAASSSIAWGSAAPDAASVGPGACLLACRPVTGRTHQIRVHCAHAGHPLLGDELYGATGPWIGRQALHALALTLQHPSTGADVTFVAPPPPDFAAAAAAVGLQLPGLEQLQQLARERGAASS